MRNDHRVIQFLGGIVLKFRIGSTKACDDLKDSIPNVVFDLSILDQLDDHINVPDEILCKLFCENCYFEYQVVEDERVISFFEIAEELSYDD